MRFEIVRCGACLHWHFENLPMSAVVAFEDTREVIDVAECVSVKILKYARESLTGFSSLRASGDTKSTVV